MGKNNSNKKTQLPRFLTSSFFESFYKQSYLILFFISAGLILFHFYALINGFYFTGDTISSFEPAQAGRPGNLLNVFIFYYAVWPPAVGFFFSILRFLPISIISQHHVYVFLTSILTLGAGYLIAKNLTQSKILRIIILAVALFGGAQEFLLRVAISEPLFIFFWLATILSIAKFMETYKERYLIFFTIFASGMTITRYSGISILLSLLAVILAFIFLTWREKKYSPAFAISCLVYTWVPIGVYLLRNRLINDKPFGLHDPQFPNVNLWNVFNDVLPNLSHDLLFILPLALFVGMGIIWTRKVKLFLIIAGFSSITYLFFLIFGLLNFRFQEGFHSRLLGISYPELLIAAFALGSFIANRYPRLKQFSLLGIIIGIIYLGFHTSNIASYSYYENRTNTSLVYGTEYSGDIRKLCRGKTPNKYLLIQESSRNWVAQSLHFYCQPIETVAVNSLPRIFPQNSLIYSAYKIDAPQLILAEFYQGEKKIYLYKTGPEFELKPTETLKNLQILD